jgi:hypothetical protein
MKKTIKKPFYNHPLFVSIGVFIIAQILFSLMEKTGWIPKHRDLDGKFVGNLLEKITELSFFKQWFLIYDTQWFNISTLFFALIVVIELIRSTVMFALHFKVKN